MDAETFWRLIDASLVESSGDPESQLPVLEALVADLPEPEIQAFGRIFQGYWHAAYTWPLWQAAAVLGGGCSDDGFMDFRGWLVARGRRVLEQVLADPDALAEVVVPGENGQIEGFLYVATRAWARRTGRDAEAFPYGDLPHPREPSGDRTPPADLAWRFPNLSRLVAERRAGQQ